MATSLTQYLTQWSQRDAEYQTQHRTDKQFAQAEMTNAGLSTEHQDLLFSGDRTAIQAELKQEKDKGEQPGFEEVPWSWGSV